MTGLTIPHFKTVLLTVAYAISAHAFAYSTQPTFPVPLDNLPPTKSSETPKPTKNKVTKGATSAAAEEPEAEAESEEEAGGEDADDTVENTEFTEATPIQNFIDSVLGGESGTQDSWGIGGNRFRDQTFPRMEQIRGSGLMEHCGSETPAQVKEAYEEALAYRGSCDAANRGVNQRIAINDYSSESTPPQMFIFDLTGNCLGKTAISYGNGAGRVAPQPCHLDGSHLTPAGFHLTAYHDGARYGPGNAIGLVGLEGQNSVGRGVIMHPSRWPGTASSWGCTGIGGDAFNAVKSTLGFGALVYNYFGNTQTPNRCGGTSNPTPGLPGHHTRCHLDGGSTVPSQATGGGAPALTGYPGDGGSTGTR